MNTSGQSIAINFMNYLTQIDIKKLIDIIFKRKICIYFLVVIYPNIFIWN